MHWRPLPARPSWPLGPSAFAHRYGPRHCRNSCLPSLSGSRDPHVPAAHARSIRTRQFVPDLPCALLCMSGTRLHEPPTDSSWPCRESIDRSVLRLDLAGYPADPQIIKEGNRRSLTFHPRRPRPNLSASSTVDTHTERSAPRQLQCAHVSRCRLPIASMRPKEQSAHPHIIVAQCLGDFTKHWPLRFG